MLEAVLDAALSELNRLVGVAKVQTHQDRFTLIVLTQTMNAAWSIVRVLKSGYSRFSIANARFLREGHIAVLWARARPDEAARLYADEFSGMKPKWPSSGEMAQAVKHELELEGSSKTARWSPFMIAVRKTHDQMATHAVTGWALKSAVAFDNDGTLHLRLGPSYDAAEVEETIDHLVPLFKLLLNDVVRFVERVGGMEVLDVSEECLKRADQWWQDHPVPLVELPEYPAS